MSDLTIVRLVPPRPTSATITSAEAGPGLWEITMQIDGVLWTSYQWEEEDRDKAEQQARRLVDGT